VTIGVANVAEVFLATVSFDAGSFGYGLMWTASGLGAVVARCSSPRGWSGGA
jgi:hypothetical protein